MATIHISQAEVERNLSGILARLDNETSFIIENESLPVAVLHAAPPPRLTLRERIALLPSDTTAVIDDDFPHDVEIAVASHPEPLDSSLWD